MEFNKKLTSDRGAKTPGIKFRELAKIGKNKRYQASINNAGAELINSKLEKGFGLSIVYSDEHSIIGFEPNDSLHLKWVFGATQLFNDLPLKVGKLYELKAHKNMFIIDSQQFNEGK